MHTRTWLRRLVEQLPQWRVTYTEAADLPWRAQRDRDDDGAGLDVSASSPQVLRAQCRHYPRMDATVCPSPRECAAQYHGIGGPDRGDTCECCGKTIGAR